MTDTEEAAGAPVASEASVTRPAPGDRRKRITGRVPTEGRMSIEELVQELGVGQMAVHRDLDALEHQGRLRKVRGGATATPSAPFGPTARRRGNQQVATGEAICAVGAERALTAAARRAQPLADHAEFGRRALYDPAPPADFDLAISDEHLPQEERDALQSQGVRDESAAERDGRG